MSMTINSPSGSVATAHDAADSALRAWLWTVVILVAIMVTVGGATRLTGSGLSITEWRPVTGAIPPLNDAAWLSEFEKYRQIPQYQLLNKGMSLGEFQFIYWWEWGHRQLGRMIGLVYALGLFLLAVSRRIDFRTGCILFGMGLVLGLQGVIGWIMVASGLQEGMIAVAPVKLTLHLTFACLFFASLIAMLQRSGAFAAAGAGGFVMARWILLGLVFLQIALGGLVAGSKAGFTFNTWPLMDGRLIPPAETLFAASPFWSNFAGNVALVQFNHRVGAYALLIFAFLHVVRLRAAGTVGHDLLIALLLAGTVLAQAILGIVTLLLQVPLWAGLLHQAFALVVLALAVLHAGGHALASRARLA